MVAGTHPQAMCIRVMAMVKRSMARLFRGDTFANGQTQWALQNADLPCFSVCRIWVFVLLW